jgi:D-Ala-D-Ala ligase-like protein
MKRVAVLMGGWSAEREVSLSSGRESAAALKTRGYDVRVIDVTRDLGALMAALTPRPDTVFNALHGRGGEDGTIQGVLEFLQIPYTHSGVLASSIAMDKPMAKAVFARAGLPLAEGIVVPRESLGVADPLPAPFVVKPTNEGSHRPPERQFLARGGARLGLQRGARRALHPRPRDHRRRDGRPRPRRLRDPPARQLLRLHGEIRRGRLRASRPGADPSPGL